MELIFLVWVFLGVRFLMFCVFKFDGLLRLFFFCFWMRDKTLGFVSFLLFLNFLTFVSIV